MNWNRKELVGDSKLQILRYRQICRQYGLSETKIHMNTYDEEKYWWAWKFVFKRYILSKFYFIQKTSLHWKWTPHNCLRLLLVDSCSVDSWSFPCKNISANLFLVMVKLPLKKFFQNFLIKFIVTSMGIVVQYNWIGRWPI